jgi:hypothetical protein
MTQTPEWQPGGRFADVDGWVGPPDTGPHVWRTLGFRRQHGPAGTSTVLWEASADYSFPTSNGRVIQGGPGDGRAGFGDGRRVLDAA